MLNKKKIKLVDGTTMSYESIDVSNDNKGLYIMNPIMEGLQYKQIYVLRESILYITE